MSSRSTSDSDDDLPVPVLLGEKPVQSVEAVVGADAEVEADAQDAIAADEDEGDEDKDKDEDDDQKPSDVPQAQPIDSPILAAVLQNMNTDEIEAVIEKEKENGKLEDFPNVLNAPDSTGNTALHHAAYKGKIDTVKLLIRHGASVNATGSCDQSVLHWAVLGGHVGIVHYLIENGADVHYTDVDGRSAIHHSSMHGLALCLHYLRCRGLGLMDRDSEGHTPLHWAAFKEKREAVKYLVSCHKEADSEAGGNGKLLDCIDEVNGRTALHYIASHGTPKMAKLLIREGANPMIQDLKEQTPLDIAIAKNRHGMIQALRDGEKKWRQSCGIRIERILGSNWFTISYSVFVLTVWALVLKFAPSYMPWAVIVPIVVMLYAFGSCCCIGGFASNPDVEDGKHISFFQPTFAFLSNCAAYVALIVDILPVTGLYPSIFTFFILSGVTMYGTLLSFILLKLPSPYPCRHSDEDEGATTRDTELAELAEHGDALTTLAKSKLQDVTDDESIGFCIFCRRIAVARSHHCRQCGVCVARFDHHCGWVSQCVGEPNHIRFLIYVWSCALHAAFGLSYFGIFYSIPRADSLAVYQASPLVLCTLIMTCILLVIVFGQVVGQSINVLKNRTGYEDMYPNKMKNAATVQGVFGSNLNPENPWDVGWKQNCSMFCASSAKNDLLFRSLCSSGSASTDRSRSTSDDGVDLNVV